ncbi:GNAT family N-acetyltransferase [Nocardia neocaledoniensis]|uniref:GNAT family N-acetyltransferase n=1 Tax=Nocardia neocaledoniensis TaxID=236511 RepID=UPI0024549B7A|nr:GNAT family N-acetyltransferase [Nocardia neocaledoniensis]
MATEVRKNAALERFELTADGVPAGYIEYQDTGAERALVHTEVFPRFEGQGLANVLVKHALDASRGEGFEVLPLCPMVLHFITTHPDYIALVPQRARALFGLPQ